MKKSTFQNIVLSVLILAFWIENIYYYGFIRGNIVTVSFIVLDVIVVIIIHLIAVRIKWKEE